MPPIMKPLAFRHLTRRLVVTVGVSLLLFSTVAGILTYRYNYRHELGVAESLQKQLVRTVQDQAEVAAFAPNVEIARGVVDGLVANPFVLAARIESKDGLSLAASAVAGVGTNGGTSTNYALLSPVDHAELVGTLIVQQNDAYVDRLATRAAAFQTAVMLIQVLVAVLLMAAVLRSMMIVPITRLAKAMGSIQPGSSARLTVEPSHAEDEIGLLSKSANALLDASEATLKKERGLRELLETTGNIAQIGGWQLDLATGVLTWSRELYSVLERDPAQPVSLRAALRHLSRPTRAELVRAARRALQRGDAFDLELPLRTAAGREIWARVQGQDKSEPEGRCLYGALQDVTDRKEAEKGLIAAKHAAETANVAKSRFLAAASHDLRQPIQAINLFGDALKRTALNPEQQRITECLSLSTQSLSDLLNALLDISRLDAGSVKPRLGPVDVESVFRHIDALFSPLAMIKSLRFRLCFPLHDMTLFTDDRLLQSLLGNLVGNAIKYTRGGGVLVALRRRGNEALIQVWDTGIGIDDEYLGMIFEEYFQIDNPERSSAKGLGLGLSVAQRLAHLLKTRIVCRSRPGRGSLFEFRLPLVDRLPAPVADELAGVADSAFPPCRIVVVDDDDMVSKALALALESIGMQVTNHRCAEDALADPDIAGVTTYISDFRLPGLNGIQFLDTVQDRTTQRIRAVVLTGDTSPDRLKQTQSSRWPVLFKPIHLPTLVSAIAAQAEPLA